MAAYGAESQGLDATHGLEGVTRMKRKEKRARRQRSLSSLPSLTPAPLSSKGGQSFVLEKRRRGLFLVPATSNMRCVPVVW